MFPTLNLLHEFLFSHKVFQGLIKVFFFFLSGELDTSQPQALRVSSLEQAVAADWREHQGWLDSGWCVAAAALALSGQLANIQQADCRKRTCCAG